MKGTLNKLEEISSRLELLENQAEWIAKESVHTDNVISQSGTLIYVLADEVRSKVFELVHELEERLSEVTH